MADQPFNLNNATAPLIASEAQNADKNAPKVSALEVRTAIRAWIMPLSAMGLLALLGVFVIKPWYEDIAEKMTALKDGRTEISDLMTKIDVLNTQVPEDLRAYLVRLNFAVPSQSSPPLVLASIEQALNSAGMAVESVQYGGIRQKEELQRGGVVVSTSDDLQSQQAQADSSDPLKSLAGGYVDVSLGAQGDYGQVVEFLKTVHKINPLILAMNFRLTLNQTEGGSPDTVDKSFSFEGSGPFQDIPQDLGAINTPATSLSRDELRLIEGLQGLTTFFDPEKVTETNQYPAGKSNPF
ncbi:hypothetical protein HGA91_04275 [candidate division WWE3 bacterium]|nr:hypothetical protein [candidate division WWE3 bacterium]